MLRYVHILILLVLLPRCLSAQNYTLKECIKKVIAENVQVKSAGTSADIAALVQKNAANTYIPSLSLSNQHNLSTGRVLDPTTYKFVTNRTVYDNSYSIVGSMTLFSGFERYRNVKKRELSLQSVILETERIRNDLSLNVIVLFLEILLDKEAIAIYENKIAMLEDQKNLIARKIEFKAATPSDLLNVQADIANARVELATTMNYFNIDKISMCELLEIDNWKDFDVVVDEKYEDIEPRLWKEEDVISYAYTLPQIKQGELAIDLAKKDIAIASSSFWPKVKINAGYGSTFSNARIKSSGEKYNLWNQMQDNMSSYVTLSFSIPILNAISVSNTVRQKKLALARAEYELAKSKLSLSKDVKKAIVNANTSYEKYTLLTSDICKYREALRQIREKYDIGAATYYDYRLAISNLFQAETQRHRYRYEYLLRTKLINFYAGQSLLD